MKKLDKKYIGIITITLSFIALVGIIIYMFFTIQNLTTNSEVDPAIDILTQENLKLQEELATAQNTDQLQIITVAEEFIKAKFYSENSQFKDMIVALEPYSTDELIESLIIERTEINPEATIDTPVNYGETKYTSMAENLNTFYKTDGFGTARVLSDFEVVVTIDGSEVVSRYIFEAELIYINDTWLVSSIIKSDAVNTI